MSKETFRNLVSVEAKLDSIFDSQIELSSDQKRLEKRLDSIFDSQIELSSDQKRLEKRIESIEINIVAKRRTDTIISAICGAVISLATTSAALYAYLKGLIK